MYGNSLGLLAKPPPPAAAPIKTSATSNGTQPSSYNPEEIIVYSTRYRRTFQSAMALMFAFVPTERWQSLTIRESHSLAFCFADCACAQAIQLKNDLAREATKMLIDHTVIATVIHFIGSSLLQTPSAQLQPMEVRDAVLSIVCHSSPLPCRRNQAYDYRGLVVADDEQSTPDPNDFINIDQDDNTKQADDSKIAQQQQQQIMEAADDDTRNDGVGGAAGGGGGGCIEDRHVATLMSYTNWQGQIEARHRFTRQQGLLRAYGLIRNIVGYMLKMVSGDKTKFVLYSGHDRTIQFLMAALGCQSMDYFVPYAARMAFEVYRSDKGREYYFRLVYNGRDITRDIDVCEGGKSLTVSKDSRGNKADLCPIENIIRFIHDDYFSPLNATNFKDACTTTTTVVNSKVNSKGKIEVFTDART